MYFIDGDPGGRCVARAQSATFSTNEVRTLRISLVPLSRQICGAPKREQGNQREERERASLTCCRAEVTAEGLMRRAVSRKLLRGRRAGQSKRERK
jgi:hypothetical protein